VGERREEGRMEGRMGGMKEENGGIEEMGILLEVQDPHPIMSANIHIRLLICAE